MQVSRGPLSDDGVEAGVPWLARIAADAGEDAGVAASAAVACRVSPMAWSVGPPSGADGVLDAFNADAMGLSFAGSVT